MNAELLSLLRCPKCQGELDVADPACELRCRRCAAAFPVKGGVPRFAGESYVASFGRQWNRYDVARDEEDEATFAVKTGVAPGDLAGRLVLDAPLADGQFDLVFSIGVLHHSPDPRRAFAQVASKVKPGGRLAVWLYRRNTLPQEAINTAARALTT